MYNNNVARLTSSIGELLREKGSTLEINEVRFDSAVQLRDYIIAKEGVSFSISSVWLDGSFMRVDLTRVDIKPNKWGTIGALGMSRINDMWQVMNVFGYVVNNDIIEMSDLAAEEYSIRRIK